MSSFTTDQNENETSKMTSSAVVEPEKTKQTVAAPQAVSFSLECGTLGGEAFVVDCRVHADRMKVDAKCAELGDNGPEWAETFLPELGAHKDGSRVGCVEKAQGQVGDGPDEEKTLPNNAIVARGDGLLARVVARALAVLRQQLLRKGDVVLVLEGRSNRNASEGDLDSGSGDSESEESEDGGERGSVAEQLGEKLVRIADGDVLELRVGIGPGPTLPAPWAEVDVFRDPTVYMDVMYGGEARAALFKSGDARCMNMPLHGETLLGLVIARWTEIPWALWQQIFVDWAGSQPQAMLDALDCDWGWPQAPRELETTHDQLRALLNGRDSRGETVLMRAVRKGVHWQHAIDVVRALLSSGLLSDCTVNARDPGLVADGNEQTALTLCFSNGEMHQSGTIQALLRTEKLRSETVRTLGFLISNDSCELLSHFKI